MKKEDKMHFIGIGGISMSGIAKIFLNRGYIISGSDLNNSHLLEDLKSKGVKIHIGHDAEYVQDADIVVISSAIPENNPELLYAREKKIPVYKRAEMIAGLMKEYKGIAVAGTHGKTTTTSMTAAVLKKGGLDPTVLVGGELNVIGGNVCTGKGDYLLTEADESDGSLLYYEPWIEVITNIEMDHVDYYDSEEKLLNTFISFMEKTPDNGCIVACAEDKVLNYLLEKNIDKNNIFTYGFDRGDLRAVKCRYKPFGSSYNLFYNEKYYANINLQVPGKHNILNSLAAIAVALNIGMSKESIVKGIESYHGVNRRFEKKGVVNNVLIIDDYGHHPTEIRATISTAVNTGYERLIAVFQPHRYSRTQSLMNDFVDAFDGVDHLIITDIYAAGEKNISGVKASDLAVKIAQRKKFKVEYIAELEDVVRYLENYVLPKDLVLTIGAGTVYKTGEKLLNKMKNKKEMA